MMNYKILIVVSMLVLSQLMKAQTILTDRPDQTEGSSTVPKKSFQIETGVLIGFSEENQQTERQLLAPTTLFRIGILEGFELRVVSQFESLKYNHGISTSGISDLEVGAKIQLLHKENVNTEIAFLSHIILPTGSTELSNNAFGTVNKVSISYALNETLDLGYNIGYSYFGEDNGDLTYSLVMGIGLTKTVGLYVETYGEWLSFETLQANMDAGFTYLVKENLQLDVSFGTGINHSMNYIAAGCSINFAQGQ